MGYAGDGHLLALLAAQGIDADIAAVRDLVAGVNAAPEGRDPDAWLDLVAPAEASELRKQLRALKEEQGARRPNEPPLAERLQALRVALREQGLTGLVLPRTDEHGSEYLPAAAERVRWLTGFTGSAGIAVVLADKAALFVDGRYTEQAKREVVAALFERCHLTERPPARWLADNLPEGGRLGYDPELHRKDDLERLRQAVAKAGGELVPQEVNPVDAIWASRPPAPIAPLRRHEERFAGESAAAKRARMGEAVAGSRAELTVLSAPDSIAWLLNLRGGDIPYNPLVLAYALLFADGRVELFLDPRKLPRGFTFDDGVEPRPIALFRARLDELGAAGARVMLDPKTSNVALFERLGRAGAGVVEGEDPCVLAKACKNAVELEGAVAAQRRDGAALCRFLAWLEAEAARRPLDEIEAAERLEAERARDSLYEGPSFPTISAAGPNGAIVHYRVRAETNRRLEPGSLYLVDSGGQYRDATTDVTRTVAIGTPSEAMRRDFTLVLKGHIALARVLFPVGTAGGQLDGFARRALWQAGLDFDHGTGHGIGSYLCVHEGPARIAKRGAEVALKPGMILSNEPGCYREGAYGVRIENLVAVVEHPTPEGGDKELLAFRTLTRAPIDRRLIDLDRLASDERAWLDRYHATVRGENEPLLAGAAAAWLRAATAPLG